MYFDKIELAVHMLRILFLSLLVSFSLLSKAQIIVQTEGEAPKGRDTLQVVFHNDKWVIAHTIKWGETLFKLSKRYHVPPALLADMNKVSYQTGLVPDSTLYIPLGAYNQVKRNSTNRSDIRPLLYKVGKYDNLFRIAHVSGVQQKQMQKWNKMPDNYIEEGRQLFVGWVLYDMTAEEAGVEEVNKKKKGKSLDSIAKKKEKKVGYDTVKKVVNGKTVIVLRKNWRDTLPKIERLYMSQTSDEKLVVEEKGAAVFFEMKNKPTGAKKYYAFHNTAKVGTIIKVHNPGTDKTVFVKVLGPVPQTKQYHNCIIGISSGAKEKLLAVEDKLWCELKFAPNNL